MWANNPTLVGIVEAVNTFDCQLGDIRVFSLGTTLDTGTRPDRLDHGGLLPWAGDAIDVVLRGQTITADNHAHPLLAQARAGKIPHHRLGHYVRFDPDDLAHWLRETRGEPSIGRHER